MVKKCPTLVGQTLKKGFGNKSTLDQRFGANLKKHCFAKFSSKFVTFLYFFSCVAYLNQRLAASHPKRWFSAFLCKKAEKIQKSNKFAARFSKTMFF